MAVQVVLASAVGERVGVRVGTGKVGELVGLDVGLSAGGPCILSTKLKQLLLQDSPFTQPSIWSTEKAEKPSE